MFTLINIMMLATKYNIQLNVKKPSLNSLLKGNILNKKTNSQLLKN